MAKKKAETTYMKAIREAEKRLTPADKAKIKARYKNVRMRDEDETSESRSEGPSKPKRKGVNPRNWVTSLTTRISTSRRNAPSMSCSNRLRTS
jgi:hypothetical protein